MSSGAHPRASVRYRGRPRAIIFLERPNRYLARVRPSSGGPSLDVHVPNPGRMHELLIPGCTRGWIVPAPGPERRTAHDLVCVRNSGTLVSIDSRIANRLMAIVLGARRVCDEAGARGGWRREVVLGRHRFDFGRFERRRGSLVELLEVKSSNLRAGRTALFPDAPTPRGAAHLRSLARFARNGGRAGVLFAVQRDDVSEFAPHRTLDADFGRAFDAAARAGVRLRARKLRVEPGRVAWGDAIPVRRNAPSGGYKGVRNPSPER